MACWDSNKEPEVALPSERGAEREAGGRAEMQGLQQAAAGAEERETLGPGTEIETEGTVAGTLPSLVGQDQQGQEQEGLAASLGKGRAPKDKGSSCLS